MKLTKHRQEILSYLKRSVHAVSVHDIHTALPHINVVTIYRNLEYLSAEHSIKKLHLDTTEAVFEYQEEPHHHAICRTCQKVYHFAIDDQALMQEFSLPGFYISGLEVTLRGTCSKKCALQQEPRPKTK